MKTRTRISKFGKTCNYILARLHFIAVARLYVGRTQAGKFFPNCSKKRASGTIVPTCSNSMWKFTVCNYKTTIVVSVRVLFSFQQAHPLSQTRRQESAAQNTDSAHFLQRGCDSNESAATVFVINNCSLFQMFVCWCCVIYALTPWVNFDRQVMLTLLGPKSKKIVTNMCLFKI